MKLIAVKNSRGAVTGVKAVAAKRAKNPAKKTAKRALPWVVRPKDIAALKYWPASFHGFYFSTEKKAIEAAQNMANFHGYQFAVIELD